MALYQTTGIVSLLEFAVKRSVAAKWTGLRISLVRFIWFHRGGYYGQSI